MEPLTAKYNLTVVNIPEKRAGDRLFLVSSTCRFPGEVGNLTKFNDALGEIINKEYEIRQATYPAYDETSHCLIKKYLTQELWEKLKDVKCSNGSTFYMNITPGIENPHSHVGTFLHETEAYTLYKELLDPVVDDYHIGFAGDAVHPRSLDISAMTIDNPDPEGKYIRSTRIRVGRNVVGYPLTPGITRAQRKELRDKIVATLETLEGDLKGDFYDLETMSAKENNQLVMDHFLYEYPLGIIESSGSARMWPESRGIFFN
jgi:hypothetical protein